MNHRVISTTIHTTPKINDINMVTEIFRMQIRFVNAQESSERAELYSHDTKMTITSMQGDDPTVKYPQPQWNQLSGNLKNTPTKRTAATSQSPRSPKKKRPLERSTLQDEQPQAEETMDMRPNA